MVDTQLRIVRIASGVPVVTTARIEEGAGYKVSDESIRVELRKDIYPDNVT